MRLYTLTLLPICLLVAGLLWVLPSYAQVTQTFCSTDVPLPIPSGAPGETRGLTQSDLDVPQGDLGCRVITNVDVQLHITHTFAADLQPVDLTSPDGTNVVLWSGVGGLSDDFGTSCGDGPDFILSDFAAEAILTGVGGTFLPQNPLSTPPSSCDPSGSTFYGLNAVGMWTLSINDALGGDIGALECWCLDIEADDVVPPIVRCAPTTNPHGQNVPPAGQNSPGQNEDGFYELLARDNCDEEVEIFVEDTEGNSCGPFYSGDKVKITQAPGGQGKCQQMGSSNGQAGAVATHVILPGDTTAVATDAAGNQNSVRCLVPPPPK